MGAYERIRSLYHTHQMLSFFHSEAVEQEYRVVADIHPRIFAYTALLLLTYAPPNSQFGIFISTIKVLSISFLYALAM